MLDTFPNKKIEIETKNKNQLDNIAEQWVFLCIQQIQAREKLKGNKKNEKSRKN